VEEQMEQMEERMLELRTQYTRKKFHLNANLLNTIKHFFIRTKLGIVLAKKK
jgi:hypothetical protein